MYFFPIPVLFEHLILVEVVSFRDSGFHELPLLRFWLPPPPSNTFALSGPKVVMNPKVASF